MSSSPRIFYEFGPFQLDPVRCLLRRDGETVPLTLKVFRILLVLVQNSERVISKEELIERVWPNTYVEEGNLTQNIFVLRKALGESPNDRRYIMTIPGQGYQFVGDVREVTDESAAEHAGEAARPPAPRRVTTTSTIPSAAVTSLAVLPFTHLNHDSGDDYLGPGIADALITKLSSISRIIVRPTTSILKYTDMDRNPLGAGRELDVDIVLDGKIQRAHERIRVTVQLLRVQNGQPLWAEKFDDSFTDVFTVQDRVAEQVARALTLKLTSEELRLLTKRYTENPEAFKAYLKGRHFWNKRTVKGLRQAIEHAQQAIDIDPTYALAYVGLADAYNLMAGHGGFPPKETFPKAKAAVRRALEIDDALAEAYTSLGFINYRFDWDWPHAEQNFKRAIELKPNYATAHHWYGECLAMRGRFDESVAELTLAQELDPLSFPINTDLGQSLFFARQYDQAIIQIRKMLEMDQNFARARIILGAAYEQLGMYKEAVAELHKAAQLEAENNSLAAAGLGHAYAVSGQEEKARRILDRLKELAATRYISACSMALIHVGLGEHAPALDYLQSAYEDRCVWLVWLGVNPRYDRFRAEPGFQDLLHRIGLVP